MFDSVFLNLSPKFYVALTGTSSLISGLILIFEWYYFKRYGISFIEQISLNHISPFLSSENSQNGDQNGNGQFAGELKVWRNSFNLFRGAEYQRFFFATGKEPLTYYDMNLSASDHQNFFTCSNDAGKPDYKLMSIAWRERNPISRIKNAKKALEINPENSCAYILLAEEEATTIREAEVILKQALKVAEINYKKSQGSLYESMHRRDANVCIYIKRRLAMCARKLGKLKEAAKIFRDLTKEPPSSIISVLNVHENLLECLLEMKNYADCASVLAKYDDISLPKSAAICYTAALLKVRLVSEKFQPEISSRKGLTSQELQAVEAIHRAVEFNPHVPKYLLEMKKLIFPAEHILKRGDSEALAYAFFNLRHWKNVNGALNLLQNTWEGTFRLIQTPLNKGIYFFPYTECVSCERELLPSFHELSVYPKKEVPFFILFTAGLCSCTALLALLTHSYPDSMYLFSQTVLNFVLTPFKFFKEMMNY
ncbi:hypothetical protein PVAND_008811 [Polypedilum vanderplanki]|uniref:Protein ST7 homolog n=1 Tax=Polypedilum vanderplanki TaxID=319348 RepID=A0A9J6CB55_POLVA|nr:hypothetical protein PVAND_008811 [Polypedilum vanderplanki]